MGNVESVENDDTTITYMITDPENPEKSFKSVIYLGVSFLYVTFKKCQTEFPILFLS